MRPTRRSVWRACTWQAAIRDLDAMLARIQNDLFDLGADLCVPETAPPETARQQPQRERLRVSEAQVERLEAEIDRMNAQLQPLRSFVLPGGTAVAAALHVARTVCRRAERACGRPGRRAPGGNARERAGAQIHQPPIRPPLRRQPRGQRPRQRDVLWVPGQNR